MKKTTRFLLRSENPPTLKILKIMKLTMIILFSTAMLVSAGTYSQNTKLTLDYSEISFGDLFSKIEAQSEYSFAYNGSNFDANQKVSVNIAHGTIKEILDEILPHNVSYEIINKYIIIRNANEPNSSVAQQQKAISGKVTDSSGASLPGVSVVIKGTSFGTITDANGSFSLSNIPANSVLQFSFVGMKSQEVKVGNQPKVSVVLAEENYGIDEVVAIGYGKEKKGNLTSSVSVVKSEELKQAPINNVSNGLGGKVSGLITRSWGGEPGWDGAQLLVRGVSTTGDNSPLVVVDGIPGRDLGQIDLNDIESITVLKDASAVAPYGARGANGVILVTTKRGKTSKPTVTYTAYYGIQKPTKLPKFCNSADFATMQNEAYENVGQPKPWTDDDITKFRLGNSPEYPNTDWFAEILEKNPAQSQQNLSVNGGNERVKYFLSLGYFSQAGLWGNVNYDKYSFRSNIDADITKDIKVSFDASGYTGNKMGAVSGTWDFLGNPMRVTPVFPVKNADGNYVRAAAGDNPVAYIEEGGYARYITNSFHGTLSTEIKVPFIDGLSFKGLAVFDRDFGSDKSFSTPYSTWNMVNRTTATYEEVKPSTGPSLSETYWQNQNVLLEAHARYSKTFGNHKINGLFVYTQSKSTNDWLLGKRINFLSPAIDQMFAGPAANQSTDGSASVSANQGMVGRLTYDFKGKYLFESNFRYDGSDRFPKDKRFGFFPSFAFGWRISEESFFKNNVRFINNLKLRGSWGKAGNDRVPLYQYMGNYGFSGTPYPFGGAYVQTATESRLPNPNITWEKANLSDLGLEASFLNDLITTEIDFFYKKTTDILRPTGRASSIIGIALPDENIGAVENKGIEMQIGHRNKFRGLKYNVSFNFTYTKNKALDLGEAVGLLNDPFRSRTGKPLGQYFGRLNDGLFVSQDEIDGWKIDQGSGLKPGDIKYKDINGPDGKPDGKIDGYDETAIGYSNIPEIIYGLNLGLEYKGFDLNLFFQGAAHMSFMYSSQGANAFDNGGKIMVWQMENRFNEITNPDPYAKYPRLTPAPVANNTAGSDYWLRNNAYLRLKTVQLGYTFNKSNLSRFGIGDLRLYVSGQNLFTWVADKISYLDPESGDSRGFFYPQLKVYTMGINVSF